MDHKLLRRVLLLVLLALFSVQFTAQVHAIDHALEHHDHACSTYLAGQSTGVASHSTPLFWPPTGLHEVQESQAAGCHSSESALAYFSRAPPR